MGKIGRYSLQKELGRGTVATVWLAEDGSDRVAIKQMYSHLADDEIMRERFIREFQTASGLHHPSIVEIYELIEEDGIPALVMEYVEHGNLTQFAVTIIDYLRASIVAFLKRPNKSNFIQRIDDCFLDSKKEAEIVNSIFMPY